MCVWSFFSLKKMSNHGCSCWCMLFLLANICKFISPKAVFHLCICSVFLHLSCFHLLLSVCFKPVTLCCLIMVTTYFRKTLTRYRYSTDSIERTSLSGSRYTSFESSSERPSYSDTFEDVKSDEETELSLTQTVSSLKCPCNSYFFKINFQTKKSLFKTNQIEF